MDQRIKELERRTPREATVKAVKLDNRSHSAHEVNRSTNAVVDVRVFLTYLLFLCIFLLIVFIIAK